MAESWELLRTAPERAPTDEYFCALVWTHRVSEDIGQQFSMDDPDDGVNINEPRTAYALKKLERDLEQYQKSLPKELLQRRSSDEAPSRPGSADISPQLP